MAARKSVAGHKELNALVSDIRLFSSRRKRALRIVSNVRLLSPSEEKPYVLVSGITLLSPSQKKNVIDGPGHNDLFVKLLKRFQDAAAKIFRLHAAAA